MSHYVSSVAGPGTTARFDPAAATAGFGFLFHGSQVVRVTPFQKGAQVPCAARCCRQNFEGEFLEKIDEIMRTNGIRAHDRAHPERPAGLGPGRPQVFTNPRESYGNKTNPDGFPLKKDHGLKDPLTKVNCPGS